MGEVDKEEVWEGRVILAYILIAKVKVLGGN